MPNESSVPAWVASLEDRTLDFGRIANALERIATVLEKLTGEKTKPPPHTKPEPQANSRSGKKQPVLTKTAKLIKEYNYKGKTEYNKRLKSKAKENEYLNSRS